MYNTFNLNNTRQSQAPFVKLNEIIWKKTKTACDRTHFGRLLGIPVFIISVPLEVAADVAKIGEGTLKGLANILASPFSQTGRANQAFRGIKQIACTIPETFGLLCSPLFIFVGTFHIPLAVLIGGSKFANKQYEHYIRNYNPN